jgi:hypothetical protein
MSKIRDQDIRYRQGIDKIMQGITLIQYRDLEGKRSSDAKTIVLQVRYGLLGPQRRLSDGKAI